MDRRFFIKNLSFGVAIPSFTTNSFFSKNKIDMPRAVIKPQRLQKGDTIGLVVPASPVSEEKIEKAIANLEGQGFKVKYTDAIRLRYGHVAGSDEARVKDLHTMFADKTVKAVWCIRGGYGCTRILPKIDYNLIKKNPKIIIGYSDVTALLHAIQQKTGLICFHGPVGATPFTEYNVEHLTKTLISPSLPYKIEQSKINLEKTTVGYTPEVIKSGKAQGQLTGGNLCLLSSMVGTPYQVNFKDKLVFLEDVGEKPYRIDRMLTQLLQSSNLHQAKGIILGIFEDCQPKDEQYSLSLIQTFNDRFANLNMPILYGFSFGHIQNMCTFPLGINAAFDADEMTVSFLENAVL